MSRSLLRQARSHRRTAVLGGAVCALAAVATLLVTGSAQASDPTPPTASPSCELATLKGTYLFEGNGASVSGTTTTPTAFAGSEHFNGAGAVTGSSTFSSGGTIFPRSAFTGTYTLTAGCTGTLTIGTTLHFDIYVASSGDKFTYVQTDPGSVSAATETRVSRT
ncbi:MAG TPA: hypothetical protein VIY28_12240 [Pseudonocardiaceae bacterium]